VVVLVVTVDLSPEQVAVAGSAFMTLLFVLSLIAGLIWGKR